MPGEKDRIAETAKSIGSLNENVHQILTLGLLTYRKWDKAITRHKRPSINQVAEFDDFTKDEIASFVQDASNLLKRYNAEVATSKRHPMTWVEWWWGVLQGFTSCFLYSLFLIAVTILGSKLAGHDLIDILREAFKP